jgi:protein TonB
MRHSLSLLVVVAVAWSRTASAQSTQLKSDATVGQTEPQAYFEFQVEKPVQSRPGNPHPKYPDSMRAEGRDGEVVAQFVIDTTGRVDMSTFEVMKSTDKSFTVAVEKTLPDMRYYPAEIGGHKVRQLAQQDFRFAP